MADIIFADGFRFENPRENAPSFVKGKLSIKAEEAIKFIQEHESEGWVNIDIKESKGGKLYMALDTYKKDSKEEVKQEAKKVVKEEESVIDYPENNLDLIPF